MKGNAQVATLDEVVASQSRRNLVSLRTERFAGSVVT
jgi:hypothetical protein